MISSISELIKGERHDVEEMVKNYADTPEAMNVVSTSYILLKKYAFFFNNLSSFMYKTKQTNKGYYSLF